MHQARWLTATRATPRRTPVIFREVRLAGVASAPAITWAMEVEGAGGLTVRCREALLVQDLAMLLRGVGHEVLRLKDHLPTESPDALVIGKGQELDAILLSLNGDFGHWFSLKWLGHLGHEFARAGCPCHLKLNQHPSFGKT